MIKVKLNCWRVADAQKFLSSLYKTNFKIDKLFDDEIPKTLSRQQLKAYNSFALAYISSGQRTFDYCYCKSLSIIIDGNKLTAHYSIKKGIIFGCTKKYTFEYERKENDKISDEIFNYLK